MKYFLPLIITSIITIIGYAHLFIKIYYYNQPENWYLVFFVALPVSIIAIVVSLIVSIIILLIFRKKNSNSDIKKSEDEEI